jgi:hypothetical protein
LMRSPRSASTGSASRARRLAVSRSPRVRRRSSGWRGSGPGCCAGRAARRAAGPRADGPRPARTSRIIISRSARLLRLRASSTKLPSCALHLEASSASASDSG